MLPLLGIRNLKARDIVGYATLQFVIHTPLVLFLVWAMNHRQPREFSESATAGHRR
jgi:hypothetical protein